MSRILLLGSQHGDEHLGEKLYQYLCEKRPELAGYVECLVGNPKARQQNVRYIESDLNRSYSGKCETYEERRAAEILTYIQDGDFGLVLDLHTTVCYQPPSMIMASINSRSEGFIRASSIKHVVIMEPVTVRASLNGVCPQAVSVEFNRNFTDTDLSKLCDDIQRYTDNESYIGNKYVYELDLLRKDEISEEEFSQLRNFELSPMGYYPVLVGESSYLKSGYDYLGFKADKRYDFKVY